MYVVMWQTNLKDTQLELESARTLREEVAGAHKDLEKRYKALEEELLHTQQDLLASERARKDLQVEKEEIAEEIETASRLKIKHFYCILQSMAGLIR